MEKAKIIKNGNTNISNIKNKGKISLPTKYFEMLEKEIINYDYIEELTELYPNDAELGKFVRSLINNIKNKLNQL